jgi:propionyl-CoA carboxylase alpha chain
MNRLLVANRGEIARRIFSTCAAMGIETVAVYSDADADAPHVRAADLAVRLPGNTPAETYLRADLLIDAARRAGADAVHPGYGFLAENAEFAAAVLDAGLTWIGPPAKAIAAMGSKVEAKARLAEAGVPMLPSWTSPDQVESLCGAGQESNFPVLVKASAGGGGRGMRIVTEPAGLPAAIEGAEQEALSAFGDGTVFCERYVATGRHIEVQVFGDTHGTVVALGERECSIQRRHQKILEESPSPAVSAKLRAALFEAAVTAARAVDYVGAGTVEFLLDPSTEDFYFLEMNTRLQVEHPVTECVTGLDLVRLQLLVAAGEPLPLTGPPLTVGHAIEVRLYAEDPAHDWRPSTGILRRFRVDGPVRVDSSVEDGSVVSVYYDPMLAKVIAHAPTRSEAARVLARSLAGAELHGVVTNRDLLVRVLREPEFLDGGTDTAYLQRHSEVFEPRLSTGEQRAQAGLAAALASTVDDRAPAGALPSGWRNVRSAPQQVSYTAPWGALDVEYVLDRSGALVDERVRLVHRSPAQVVLEVDGVRHTYRVHRVAGVSYVDHVDGSVALTEVPRFAPPTVDQAPGSLLAPMPGAVGRVAVTLGQAVAAGDLLLTLEAMKMEHAVLAPDDGVVSELPVTPGTQVEPGTVLAVVTKIPLTGEDS